MTLHQGHRNEHAFLYHHAKFECHMYLKIILSEILVITIIVQVKTKLVKFETQLLTLNEDQGHRTEKKIL